MRSLTILDYVIVLAQQQLFIAKFLIHAELWLVGLKFSPTNKRNVTSHKKTGKNLSPEKRKKEKIPAKNTWQSRAQIVKIDIDMKTFANKPASNGLISRQ
jgi:hypothetical protein